MIKIGDKRYSAYIDDETGKIDITTFIVTSVFQCEPLLSQSYKINDDEPYSATKIKALKECLKLSCESLDKGFLKPSELIKRLQTRLKRERNHD